ncbi:amidohydrolase [Sphingomonas immobilis]|uniref:Amidohydrolase n=1 Tax=Sphingomonas immobilis TaxID=3063997 RepID=A0ABT9A3M3_9SPHN|nr:amidohydrolase [Sphingomonas sp. CA1-15]MDO7844434.1 amidohydrolase [Sphingomonas sp. CA1-15]
MKVCWLFAGALALPSAIFAAPPLDVPAAKAKIDASLARTYPDLEGLYKDLHGHPELAFAETRTAALLAARMRKLGFTVTEKVGKTGVVALYKNGDGPTVLVRVEMDGLPVEEKTGLPWASKAQQPGSDGKMTPVDQACGHDIHMAWWIGTAEALLAMKDQWHGTLMFIAQPAEEIGGGAKAMLADGLFTRFPKPDYGFAAHVFPSEAGTVLVKQGAMTSASDTVKITFKGLGAHGSMPDKSIDPIVEAAQFVTDVQTVISRRKDPQKFGVVTVGSFHAGTVANIIPDHADLQLTVRSYEPAVRTLLIDGITGTANAVAAMAGAPAPDISRTSGGETVVNDNALAASTAEVLRAALGARVSFVPESGPGWTASEDYSAFVSAGMPKSVYFSIGGVDAATIAKWKAEGKPMPVNHSPFFAPVAEPSIKAGVTTLTLAVLSVAGK